MTTPDPLPGDFAVVSVDGTGGRIISLLEGIAYAHATWWDHAFIYLGDNTIVQAQPGGAVRVPLGTYRHVIWSTGLLTPTADQRAKICSSAGWYADHHVGYSWLDYAAIGAHRFRLPVPGLRDFIKTSAHMICSQLVDQCWSNAGYPIFGDGRWAGYVSPYSLGHRLQVLALQQATRTRQVLRARDPRPGDAAADLGWTGGAGGSGWFWELAIWAGRCTIWSDTPCMADAVADARLSIRACSLVISALCLSSLAWTSPTLCSIRRS